LISIEGGLVGQMERGMTWIGWDYEAEGLIFIEGVLQGKPRPYEAEPPLLDTWVILRDT
jgi:hypothetical protein